MHKHSLALAYVFLITLFLCILSSSCTKRVSDAQIIASNLSTKSMLRQDDIRRLGKNGSFVGLSLEQLRTLCGNEDKSGDLWDCEYIKRIGECPSVMGIDSEWLKVQIVDGKVVDTRVECD
jgi:hypothetical protein